MISQGIKKKLKMLDKERAEDILENINVKKKSKIEHKDCAFY